MVWTQQKGTKAWQILIAVWIPAKDHKETQASLVTAHTQHPPKAQSKAPKSLSKKLWINNGFGYNYVNCTQNYSYGRKLWFSRSWLQLLQRMKFLRGFNAIYGSFPTVKMTWNRWYNDRSYVSVLRKYMIVKSGSSLVRCSDLTESWFDWIVETTLNYSKASQYERTNYSYFTKNKRNWKQRGNFVGCTSIDIFDEIKNIW